MSTSVPPNTDEPTAAPLDAAEHSAWFVVIDGQEQGPFPAEELCAMADRNTIARDALVSRLGDSTTRPLRDVPELRALLGPESLPTLGDLSLRAGRVTLEFEDVSPDAIVSSVPPPPDAGDAAPAVTVQPAQAPPPVPPAKPPTRVPPTRPPTREARRPSERPSMAPPIADGDLEPLGASQLPLFARLPPVEVPVDIPVETVAASERLTGARNEGSLLFRVDKDTVAAATAPSVGGVVSAGVSPSGPPRGNPSDVSGLLELQSLARKMASLSGERTDKPTAVDDLLTVNPSSTLASPLVAPPIAAPPPTTRSLLPSSPPPAGGATQTTAANRNRTMFLTAVVVALIVTGGLGLVQVLLHRMEMERAPRVVQVLPAPVVLPTRTPETHPPTLAPTPPPEFVATPTVSPEVTPVLVRPPNVGPRPPTVGPRPPGNPNHVTTNNRPDTTVTSPPPPPPPPPPEVNRDLPVTPERASVQEAMRNLAPVVRACGIEGDPAVVTVTFANTGRVTTATVAPPYAGTPAGSCMARAVRGARLPPFQQNIFEVRYPFTP